MKTVSIILAGILLAACTKHEVEPGTPPAIEKKILEFELTSCDNSACVKKFMFQSGTVFVFEPGSCVPDLTAEVTDCEGHTLGFLGGIADNRVINNESFDQAEFKSVAWQK